MTTARHASPTRLPDVPSAELPPIVLRGRPLLRGLVVVALVLAAAHFVAVLVVWAAPSAGLRVPDAVRLNAESTVATWFSSALHLVNGLVLGLLAVAAARRERWRWIVLAAMVLAVSMDEVSGFHEDVSWLLHTRLHTSGVLTYAWVVPAVAVCAVVALACTRMVLRKPGGRVVILGAAVFLAGAVGMEVIEGAWIGSTGSSPDDTGFLLLNGVEETLEMLGAIITMSGLFRMASGLRLHVR
ncbi:MAG: hypothetical protein OJJ54_19025 [Pseudonocardia sp.]|nr:hypothetical protein [Pseudonocardia sp.]